MSARRVHLLWDWNGTLLDDTPASVAALNELLSARGLPQIGLDFYRDTFSFPVRDFYAACGVRLEREDWARLAEDYHAAYLRQPRSLQREAIAALRQARQAGLGQSILSAMRQDLLEKEVAAFAVMPWMEHVFGTDNLDGASKVARARQLIARLRAEKGPLVECVMIGDSLHDHEVAAAVGARCVLVANGSHAPWRLRAVAPTAETLTEAVAMAADGA
jgi:phosphoglycolate phosphatase